MKTPFLLLLAFFIFYLPANAQLSFGIKASNTKAWYAGMNDDAEKIGGMGITFNFYKKMNKVISIGMEPGIVQRGTTQRFGDDYFFGCLCCFGDCVLPEDEPIFDPAANMLKSSYLQIPLFFQFHIPTNNRLDIYAKIGGGPSWLASGNYHTSTYDFETFKTIEENKAINFTEADPLNRWDWGAQAGIGIGYQIGAGKLVFETELYRGFSKVVNYADYKNRNHIYSFGYMINL